MNILVAGRNGQLAQALLARPWPSGTQCVALGRPALDIADAQSVREAFATHAPDVVVNAAAYTAVDRAEQERDAAFALNVEGPRNLAREAQARGIALIHLSTDYVFGGEGQRPWREDDEPAPRGVYANSKLLGEVAVREVLERHVVLRTSWLFSGYGHNFVRTMLNLAKSRSELSVVDDQWGCPTWAGDLARAIAAIAARPGPYGTYHYCGVGATNWFGFAQAIFARSHGSRPALKPISMSEFAAPAPRPSWSVLDAEKIGRDYAVAQHPWAHGLDAVIGELQA